MIIFMLLKEMEVSDDSDSETDTETESSSTESNSSCSGDGKIMPNFIWNILHLNCTEIIIF